MKCKMSINSDKLVIATDKNKFEFDRDSEFIELENGGYILRKSAISRITADEGIIISKPESMPGERFVLANRIVVLCAATKGEETVWEIGSASPDTLKGFSQNWPFEMAYNRARQRAVLCLLGLGGKIYGEDEIQDPVRKNPPTYAPNPVPQRATVITDEMPGDVPRDYPNMTDVYNLPTQPSHTQSQAPQQAYGTPQQYGVPPQPQAPLRASEPPQRARFIVRPEHQNLYSWLTQEAADQASTINPDLYVLDQGKNKDMRWTATQTMTNDPATVEWFAEHKLGSNPRFNDAIIACRAAIIASIVA